MTDPDLGTLSPTGDVQAERQWNAMVWVDHTTRFTLDKRQSSGLWLSPQAGRRIILQQPPWVSDFATDPDQGSIP